MKKVLQFIIPLFRSFLFIAIGLIFSAVFNLSLEQSSRWWSVLCTVSNIITILLLLLLCRYENITYGDLINYKKGQTNLKFTLMIVFAMLILGIGGMYAFGFMIYGYVPVTMIQPIPVWIAAINIVLLPVTTALAEMPLYFGYAVPRIEKITQNKFLAVGYPIFFYALQHSFMPLLPDWRHILFRFLSFAPLLLIFGVIYYRSRKLVPLMIGHGVLDTATGLNILVTSVSPAIFEMMKAMAK